MSYKYDGTELFSLSPHSLPPCRTYRQFLSAPANSKASQAIPSNIDYFDRLADTSIEWTLLTNRLVHNWQEEFNELENWIARYFKIDVAKKLEQLIQILYFLGVQSINTDPTELLARYQILPERLSGLPLYPDIIQTIFILVRGMDYLGVPVINNILRNNLAPPALQRKISLANGSKLPNSRFIIVLLKLYVLKNKESLPGVLTLNIGTEKTMFDQLYLMPLGAHNTAEFNIIMKKKPLPSLQMKTIVAQPFSSLHPVELKSLPESPTKPLLGEQKKSCSRWCCCFGCRHA